MQEIINLQKLEKHEIEYLTKKLISEALKNELSLKKIIIYLNGNISYSILGANSLEYSSNSFRIIVKAFLSKDKKIKHILNQLGKILFYSNYFFKESHEDLIIYDFDDNYENAKHFSEIFLSLT